MCSIPSFLLVSSPMFMLMLKLFTVCYVFMHFHKVHAGTVARGGNCTLSNNHLDTATHKLLTDCNDKTFCTPQNTCEPRQCRKDEYPFGYSPGESLPPMCPQGQYCPDEGDACKPWLSLGQTCQLNRDDECAPPPGSIGKVFSPYVNGQNPMSIGDSSSMNPNGSICLFFTCMYANATLGTPCVIDSTIYMGSGPKGEIISNTVLRDNCITPDLYCNTTSNVCDKTQELGFPCHHDLECESRNCNTQNICVVPPETPMKVAVWQYALTSAAAFLAMVATCVILVLAHKRHRMQRNAEIREYYHEQMGYRSSIIALHSVATRTRPTSVHNHSESKSVSRTCSRTISVYGDYNDVADQGVAKSRRD